MNELTKIALKYGTDKAAGKHDYTGVYFSLFNCMRYQPINILELGVDKGSSVLMWLDFFKLATVYCFDIVVPSEIEKHGRVVSFRGYQESYQDYYELRKNSFDIIIDDCSHITENTIFSYLTLFPCLKHMGYYIVEDCNAKRAKYTKEILGKYGTVYNVGRDSLIIIRR